MPAVAEAASLNLYRRQVLAGPAESSVEDTLLFEEAPSTLELPIFSTLSKFEARSTLSNHTCEAGEKGYGSLITCELPEGESGRLSLEFTTKGFVRETGKHYYFQDDFDTPYQTENMVYNAKLKEGLVLIDEDMETPFDRFSPSYGEEGSDGRRIYIVWSEENVSPGEGIQVSMSFEKTTRENGISLEVLIVITGVVLVALLLVLGANIGKGEEGSLPEALKDDERKTMEIIENSGGQIKQKRIVDAVDFSKAKVSRLVHDLKERGLLETEKVGRTNRVKLKEGN
ncbi:MAG: helix-turn-helix transcriptional regulator [Candidatus Aenigmatarchaeota archaeon]